MRVMTIIKADAIFRQRWRFVVLVNALVSIVALHRLGDCLLTSKLSRYVYNHL